MQAAFTVIAVIAVVIVAVDDVASFDVPCIFFSPISR